MAKRIKTIIIKTPIEVAYKMARGLENVSLPLISDISGGTSPSGITEDIPNQKVVLKCKGGGSFIDQGFSFRAIDKESTEVTITMEAGLLGGKVSTDVNMWLYVFSFKALEMGYMAKSGGAPVSNTCQKCGKELQPEFTSCPYCGQPR